MAANQKSAGLGHSFLALRHAEACPGPEHHRTLDSNTTRQKMLRNQREGQECPILLRASLPAGLLEIAIGRFVGNTTTCSAVTEKSTSVCQATTNEMAKQSNGAPQACYKKWSLQADRRLYWDRRARILIMARSLLHQ